MLLSGLVMFFNTSLVRYLQSSPITPGELSLGSVRRGLGELWRGAKGFIASAGLTEILFLLYTLCTIALFPLANPE